MKTEKATFGAGCFWGTEAAFRKVPGVINATAGFMGGQTKNPTWEQVARKGTGHVEVVQVEYDPTQVSYSQLLKVFWFIHDPTQVNRQGNDVGDEYRSAIFYHADEQKSEAEQSKQELEDSGGYNRPVATTIESATEFFPASEEHQRYLEKNPGGYCHVNLYKVDEFIKNRYS